jgi:hypothetical protein
LLKRASLHWSLHGKGRPPLGRQAPALCPRLSTSTGTVVDTASRIRHPAEGTVDERLGRAGAGLSRREAGRGGPPPFAGTGHEEAHETRLAAVRRTVAPGRLIPQFKELIARGDHSVVLDMPGVSFCDSG